MSRLHVLVDPLATRAPLTVRALGGLQAAARGCGPQRVLTDGPASERGERDQSSGSSDGRDNELVEVVQDRAGKELGQQTWFSRIRLTQRAQLKGALLLVDDRRWIPESDEQQVEHQATGPAVAVDERVDLLELVVQRGDPLSEVRGSCPYRPGALHPRLYAARNERRRWRSHAAREGADVVLPQGAWCLALSRGSMRRHVPDRTQGHLVYVADLRQGDEIVALPGARFDGLPVDPLRGVRVTADLQVLRQLLVADSPSLREELLDLLQDERVPSIAVEW